MRHYLRNGVHITEMPDGSLRGKWKDEEFVFRKHKGTLKWSARRLLDHPLSILAQGRSLVECVKWLKDAVKAGQRAPVNL